MSRTSVAVIFALLLSMGMLLRLRGIDDSILTFHPTRQYRSAIIARACYYNARTDVPSAVRKVADANRAMQPAGEPPLLERAACLAYRLAGAERLAIPRTLSAVAWVIGAVPLALMISRGASAGAAAIGVAIYLFAPYAVVASRAFQPDPLMTFGSLVALWLLLREHERGTRTALVAAAAAVGITLVVKPMSVFLLVPAACGLAMVRAGFARAIVDRRLFTLLALGMVPAILLYGYSTIFGTLARDQWQMRFVPSLLDSGFFWGGWFKQVQRVFGVPLLIAGVSGAVLAPERWMRTLLAALWSGYALFAVAFTYHVPTHDYYHLPFVPIAAMGAAVTVHALGIRVARFVRPIRWEAACVGIAMLIAVLGTVSVWPGLTARDVNRLRDFETIGELCAHDARVLFLDREYGYPLMYHAGIAGDAWPSADDLAAERLGGAPQVSATERFARDFEDYDPHYFVVTDLDSFAAQPDLRALLDGRATIVAAAPAYRVYRFEPRNGG